MIPEHERPTTAGDDTPSEHFTSVSSSDESSDTEVEDGKEEELVLMFGKDFESKEEEEEAILGEPLDLMLKHLPKMVRGRLKDIIEKSGTVADSLEDLRPSDVPVKHHFELKTDQPVYCKGRILSPRHNKILWEELQKMLKAGIIIPASSEWSSRARKRTDGYGSVWIIV